jgi:hypothetical protein
MDPWKFSNELPTQARNLKAISFLGSRRRAEGRSSTAVLASSSGQTQIPPFFSRGKSRYFYADVLPTLSQRAREGWGNRFHLPEKFLENDL